MHEVAICSLVRDGMDYLPSFRRQLECLRMAPGSAWRLYILEGDSRDGSWEFLNDWAKEDSRVTLAREHGGEATELEDRAARWARVGNTCLNLVLPTTAHTHVLWLEADLCFPPELLRRLLAHQVDIVAPVIFLGGFFYDTWGFRDTEGRRWTNTAPYHPKYRPMELMEMGSVGSCVLFRREILDAGIRFKGTYEHGLLVGMCEDARKAQFRVWADTGTAILHPVDQWEAQMWRPSEILVRLSNGRETRLDLGEARQQLGLEMNLSILDASAFFHAQRRFLARMVEKIRSRRLTVQIAARAYPAKSYRMTVMGVPSQSRSYIRGLLGKLWNREIQPGKSEHPAEALHRHSGKTSFSCHITISMEDPS